MDEKTRRRVRARVVDSTWVLRESMVWEMDLRLGFARESIFLKSCDAVMRMRSFLPMTLAVLVMKGVMFCGVWVRLTSFVVRDWICSRSVVIAVARMKSDNAGMMRAMRVFLMGGWVRRCLFRMRMGKKMARRRQMGRSGFSKRK